MPQSRGPQPVHPGRIGFQPVRTPFEYRPRQAEACPTAPETEALLLFSGFGTSAGRRGAGEGADCPEWGVALYPIETKGFPVFAFQRETIELSKSSAPLCPYRRRVSINCSQAKTMARVVLQVPRTGSFHRGLCFRQSTSNSALAVKTSRTASWNSRPAWTRRRTSSTHSLGIRSTRFFPLAMKVKDQAGCPGPEAQWQVGLPQRV